MSSDPPPPSDSRERLQSFTGEVLTALDEAGKATARTDAKVDALSTDVARWGRRQSWQTFTLAVVALVAQIIGSNLWRLTYKPRPAPTCIERSSYERPDPSPSAR